MIEAERQVERGIAKPRALGVDEHRTSGAEKNVLRADIAMDDGEFRLRGRVRNMVETAGQVGMGACRGEQIRLDAERVERGVRGELARGRFRPRKSAMQTRETLPDERARLRLHHASTQ